MSHIGFFSRNSKTKSKRKNNPDSEKNPHSSPEWTKKYPGVIQINFEKSQTPQSDPEPSSDSDSNSDVNSWEGYKFSDHSDQENTSDKDKQTLYNMYFGKHKEKEKKKSKNKDNTGYITWQEDMKEWRKKLKNQSGYVARHTDSDQEDTDSKVSESSSSSNSIEKKIKYLNLSPDEGGPSYVSSRTILEYGDYSSDPNLKKLTYTYKRGD